MAVVLGDRVLETSTTQGTGTLNLAGATTGFQTFVAAVGTGAQVSYIIDDGTDWETGIGTVTDGTPDTLSRDTILQSSNADAAVNWGSGTRNVRLTVPASIFPTLRSNNTFIGIDTHTAQVRWAKGADVASANALTLGTDGNYFDITGTTSITSIGALGVGTIIRLHFDAALTLTHHATDLILPGGANITTAAGDEAEFIEYATGDWRCTSYTAATGKAVVPSVTAATQADQETSTSTTTYVSPGRQQFHPASAKAWVKFTTVTTTSILASYNITSLTDNGTGDTTITIATDFSSAHYAYAAMSEYDNGLVNGDGNTPAAGTLRVVHQGSTNSTPFDGIMSVIMFGDQ